MYDPDEIKRKVKEKQEKNKKIAVKLMVFIILMYVAMFSIQSITYKNIIMNCALIVILIGLSIAIIKSLKLINKVNVKINKKMENYGKIKLIYTLLSLIVVFSVYYILSKNIIIFYILLSFLIIYTIIISIIINILYKFLDSRIISINNKFNKNTKYSTLMDLDGLTVILFSADLVILLISIITKFLNLFSVSIMAIFSLIIVLIWIYIYKSYNYGLFNIN